MAELIAGLGISHSPGMGTEYDKSSHGTNFPPEWQVWFDGTRALHDVIGELAPDHVFVIYNDHLNHFDLDNYPTFALGIGDRFRQIDEGFGLRPIEDLAGDPGWGVHFAEELVARDFDLSICHNMAVDHGILSWMSYVAQPPWPFTVTPLAVNMIRQPMPRPQRLVALGRAIGEIIRARPVDERVLVVATGGMSHQISGGRFGLANPTFDRWFLDQLGPNAERLFDIPVEEYMRVGGTEAAELTMWFAMRAALGGEVENLFLFNTFPKMTGCGAVLLAPRATEGVLP
ncbi:DODA-type extradiol aromatic ring-opening family dioxygenase [Prescottella equi]|uniref:DODA-type extradiol aromatic ring-opening family dioxygenase n=1 Tax=Rhodococcus hoagii TaxID=43767 RepID=UPI0007CD75D8|nr:hypothetical protein [Prescottella equi]